LGLSGSVCDFLTNHSIKIQLKSDSANQIVLIFMKKWDATLLSVVRVLPREAVKDLTGYVDLSVICVGCVICVICIGLEV
jgi:hypothetical protein